MLGEGAYGMVYKCQHRITEIDYAVKIIDKRLGARRQKVISNRNYSFEDGVLNSSEKVRADFLNSGLSRSRSVPSVPPIAKCSAYGRVLRD